MSTESVAPHYVEYKQSLGFDFLSQAQMLHSFEVFASGRVFDVDVVLEWSRRGIGHPAGYDRSRYETIRRFSQFAHTLDPEVPALPVGVLSRTGDRVVPYIYSDDDIAVLMRVAGTVRSPDGLKAEALPFTIGLLACTGLRISEAVALRDTDFDADAQTLTVRDSKNGHTRIIPVSDDTANHIVVYQHRRDKVNRKQCPTRLIVGTGGTPLTQDSVERDFAQIRWSLLGRGESFTGRKPRLHDLRHTFATMTILTWRDQGVDVNAMIPYLSVYLGHTKLSDTYWYLTGVPQLLESASDAFRPLFTGGGHV